MSIAITKPEPLPTDRYVSIAERKAWTTAMSVYEASLREDSKPPVTTEPEASFRYLTDEEYDEIKRKDWEEAQRRQRERDEAALAAAKARQEFLDSEPETATVIASDPFTFLTEFQHRVKQGYGLSEEGIGAFMPSYYCATLTKPAAPARKTK
ncbi:hypothetical protein [Cupriavidus sp. SW-Y-13]|uniref:hypothetical protein n=1 Tax=Cupriavidus sp. SW-Y-13 TaxID=2653854 RepID=UPI0013662B27|nr:hypothetical protein [Cupriavidus sp. SW-Y-13]MWL87678.1 hypothetical protein [Cupriavidus sp. SW-Y-13]